MNTAYWILGASRPAMATIEDILRTCEQYVVYALHGRERVQPDTAYLADGLSESIPEGARVYRVECDGPAIPASAQAIEPMHGRPPAEFMPASTIGQVIGELARIGDRRISDAPAFKWTESGLFVPYVDASRYGLARRLQPRDGLEHSVLQGRSHFPGRWFDPDGYMFCWQYMGGWAVAEHASWHTIDQQYVLAAAADHCPDAARRGECPGVDPDALVRWQHATPARQEAAGETEIP